MNKYFYKVGYVNPLYVDGNGFVELWSGWNSNINQEAREETVATIASLSYGNEKAKNPSKLYKKLQELKHESVFEFINMPFPENRVLESLRHENLPYLEKFDEKEREQLIYEHSCSIATFKIKVPIFVARQFMRHRASYLEMSRRYVKNKKVPFEFYDFSEDPRFNPEQRINIKNLLDDVYDYTVTIYEELQKQGVSAELARAVIPLGAYTIFWVQMDYEYLVNFFKLRLKKDAQFEIRIVADAMYACIMEFQPCLFEIINKELEGENENNN